MKFFNLKVGAYFNIEEKTGPSNDQRIVKTLCQKVSALGYTMSGEEVLGEHAIDPTTDAKIVEISVPAPAEPEKVIENMAVKRPPTKKSVAKKAAKKVAKKKTKK